MAKMLVINLTLLLLLAVASSSSVPSNGTNDGKMGKNKHKAQPKINCADTLDDYEEMCCKMPVILPPNAVESCKRSAATISHWDNLLNTCQMDNFPTCSSSGNYGRDDDCDACDDRGSSSSEEEDYSNEYEDDDYDWKLLDRKNKKKRNKNKQQKTKRSPRRGGGGGRHHGKGHDDYDRGGCSYNSGDPGFMSTNINGEWNINGHCFASCIFDKMNWLNPDRSLNVERLKTGIMNENGGWRSEEEKSLAMKVLQTCVDAIDKVNIARFNEPLKLNGMRCSIAANMFRDCFRKEFFAQCPNSNNIQGSSCATRLNYVKLCEPLEIPTTNNKGKSPPQWPDQDEPTMTGVIGEDLESVPIKRQQGKTQKVKNNKKKPVNAKAKQQANKNANKNQQNTNKKKQNGVANKKVQNNKKQG